jgi:hypothetical protein
MRPWLIVVGPGLALIGLQAVQAQVTIDITKTNLPPRVRQKNPNAQLAPIAVRNAHQPGTSLRSAVSLVGQDEQEKPRNIGLIRSFFRYS